MRVSHLDKQILLIPSLLHVVIWIENMIIWNIQKEVQWIVMQLLQLEDT